MYKLAICDDDAHFASQLKEALISSLHKRNINFELVIFDNPFFRYCICRYNGH